MLASHNALLRHVRSVLKPATCLSDSELLHRYRTGHDEAVFASIIARHGRMVLSVCQAVLRHRQDAEDTFQATFLVLARRAATIRQPDALASWLHGVARRLALQARGGQLADRSGRRNSLVWLLSSTMTIPR